MHNQTDQDIQIDMLWKEVERLTSCLESHACILEVYRSIIFKKHPQEFSDDQAEISSLMNSISEYVKNAIPLKKEQDAQHDSTN